MNEKQIFIVTKLTRFPNIGTVQRSFLIMDVKHETIYSINIRNNKGKK